MSDDDDLIRVIDDSGVAADQPSAAWKVAIIDDDPAVHEGTRFALYDYNINGQGIEILSAYSAEEGRELMRAHPDIAVVLLDVVMETDDAGLMLVDHIRAQLRNETVRIILRTGQPGQAPERDVVAGYDIDDYKTKSELTSQKLYTLVHASLRSYRHIRALERNLKALRRIIAAASSLHRAESMSAFASGVLEQLVAMLDLSPAAALCEAHGVAAKPVAPRLEIIAATGEFAGVVGQHADEALPADVAALLSEALARRESVIRERACVCYFSTRNDLTALVYVGLSRDLSDVERDLVDLFIRNMSVAYCSVAVGEY